jgi:hypothetical protein
MICFYLLPAIAAILKTRKRKLAQISSGLDSGLVIQSNFSTIARSSLDTILLKLKKKERLKKVVPKKKKDQIVASNKINKVLISIETTFFSRVNKTNS